jgi:hypothetical protein
MNPREKLRSKLCRELAQSEHSAIYHSTREAKRLGDVPPAHALLAIAEHARSYQKRFEIVAKEHPTLGLSIGRAVGEVFSLLRHVIFDRMIDVERSYRGTILGAKHGTDVARLLREVALVDHEAAMIDFVNAWLSEREALVRAAETQLAFFAEEPKIAIRSGLVNALGK